MPILKATVLATTILLTSCSKSVDPVTYATRSVELRVEGMTCAACEKTICTSVQAVAGVESCAADHVAGRVTIVYAPAKTDEKQLAETIRSAGYQVP